MNVISRKKIVMVTIFMIMSLVFSSQTVLADTLQTDNTTLQTDNTTINIKDIGAKGDGITDDWAVIQGALKKYDKIYFPEGTYYCSSSLYLDWYDKDSTKVLIGNSSETTTILFKDQTNITNYACLSIDVASFSMMGMTVKYVAENAPAFNRQVNGTGNGHEGILVGLFKGEGLFNNCKFIIQDSRAVIDQPVSCTGIRAKAQYGEIPKLTVSNCEFRNETGSSVGGCLWLSNEDAIGYDIKNVEITGNQFYKNGNDEVLSAWSGSNHAMTNIHIYDNAFRYTGTAYNDNFIAFYRSDTGNIIDNVTINNNEFMNNTAGDFARSLFMYFKYTNAKVYSNKIILNTTRSNARLIGVQTGSMVDFYNNECLINSSSYFVLSSYKGGSFYCRNNQFTINADTFTLIENNNTTIPNSDLLFKSNKIDCTIACPTAKQVQMQLWDTGINDISDNKFNLKAAKPVTVAFTFFSPTTPVPNELRLIGNEFAEGGLIIPGKSSSLKALSIENNISIGKIILYPSTNAYSNLTIRNNKSLDFQYNWKVMTVKDLSTMASTYLWSNNCKYSNSTQIVPF